MELAMILCAAVAAVTIPVAAVGIVARAASALRTVQIPFPARSVATFLSAVTLLTVLVRARPAAASIAPPIVRLAGDPGRTPAPSPGSPPVSTPAPSPGSPAGPVPSISPDVAGYVVQPGDCLWRIAERTLIERGDPHPSHTAIARLWPVIYAANRGTIGADPDLILPGQRLTIPEG